MKLDPLHLGLGHPDIPRGNLPHHLLDGKVGSPRIPCPLTGIPRVEYPHRFYTEWRDFGRGRPPNTKLDEEEVRSVQER